MTQKEKGYEFVRILDDVMESRFWGDSWWDEDKPLSAERFFNDSLDNETGIVYDCLDWFLLPEDVREDFVRATIEELTPIYILARDLGSRLYTMYKKYLDLGYKFGDIVSFDDWPFIGEYMITGFVLLDEGKIEFLGQKSMANPGEEEAVYLENSKEYEEIIGFIEDTF